MIPESVTPDGLRARADIVRKAGDESCARHLELAAEEIKRLRSKHFADDPTLEATGYATAIDTHTRHGKLTLTRYGKPMAHLVMEAEDVYELARGLMQNYDKIEGIT